jgi:hypothetical protein
MRKVNLDDLSDLPSFVKRKPKKRKAEEDKHPKKKKRDRSFRETIRNKE